jgi:tetratricopeptide (TPR) repeat protein
MKPVLAVFAGFLSLAAAAHGQHTLGMHTHAGTGGYSACVEGRFNGYIKPYPVEEAGSLSHPVSTNKPLAQQYFNQGLTFFYGFDSESAMRSFYQASQADTNLAMAHWGIALAAGGDVNIPLDDPCMVLAGEQLKLAYGKSPKGPEKLYIDALAKRYAGGVDPKNDYANAMRSVNQQLGSQDPDAAALFVYSLMNLDPWKWWVYDPTKKEIVPTKEITEALGVLEPRLPATTHIGLNHLYIHAMEEAPIYKAVKAESSANFLHRYAPLITPHLRHMPAHTYLLMGNWQGVVDANERAVAADGPWVEACKAYISDPKCKKCPECKQCPDFKECPECEKCNVLLVGHYYSHDLLFLAVGYNNRGEWGKVLERSQQLEKNVRNFIGGQPALEHYLTTQAMMMVHFGQWKMLTELSPPQEPMPTNFDSQGYCGELNYKLAAAMWYFGRAMGNASLKEWQSADYYVKGFEKARECVGSTDPGWGNNTATAILNVVYWRMLERIARMKDLPADSELRALRAVNAEDSLSYDEPPGWYLSSRETYGAALFLAKKYKEAEGEFRKDLERRPNNSRSLFGLWQALKAQPGKTTEAEKAEKEFRKQWPGPDPEMKNM